MAKRKQQDDTQELPPVTVETVDAKPMRTVETVEIVPASESPFPLPVDPDITQLFIIHEETGELRQVTARLGYAPVPMPAGFRLATDSEIPGK